MIHFGKDTHEQKVIIEVGDEDVALLHRALLSLPLPERRAFHGICRLIETDPELQKIIKKAIP